MVLLLLALGTLLLQGLHQQQRSLLAQTASETRALGDAADAHSALQWGKGLVWPLQETVSCQQNAALVEQAAAAAASRMMRCSR